MKDNSANKRIAKNTIYLYVCMLLNLFIGLYTSRVILQTLGVSDYGLYGVVGGVVSFIGFLKGVMSNATSRFLSYELGLNNRKKLVDTFSSIFLLHIVIAFCVVLLCEFFGIWFLENYLVVPEGRLNAAKCVLQFSIIALFFEIFQIPFNAVIFSHERMEIYSYVEVANSLLKLLIVFFLTIGQYDKLILYSALTFVISVFFSSIYLVISIKSFDECTFRLSWKKDVIKKMLSYIGWQLYGNLSLVTITQGVNLLLNIWFGTIMNAAYDIANRIKNLVMIFSFNVTRSIGPQIVKSYSSQDFSRMYTLMNFSMNISFIIMLLICVPLIIETHYLLNLWLGSVPEYAVSLIRLSLIWSLIVSLTAGYGDASNATGDIRFASLFAGTMYISTFPITYISFKFGAPFWVPFVLNIITVMFAPIYTCYALKKHIPEFYWWTHVFRGLLRCYCVMLTVLGLTYYCSTLFVESFSRLVFITCVGSVLTFIMGYYVIFTKDIRTNIIEAIRKHIRTIYGKLFS